MIDYAPLYARLRGSPLEPWLDSLPTTLASALDPQRNGNLARWLPVIEQLPPLTTHHAALDQAIVTVGDPGDCDDATRRTIRDLLRQLMPWRKGPFSIHGVDIDTEWRSDLKWQRIAPHLSPLDRRRVLDVGCGSGYHCWRMVGAGAGLVIGIDPSLLFTLQFAAVRHFIPGDPPAYVLPLALEEMPAAPDAFDTAFSMGVLYHRRSPIDHLQQLRDCLRPGGELVLETLVVAGGADTVLLPGERYAKMRNVWFIPSPAALCQWLQRCGFSNSRVVDVTPTTTEEQRATEWMQFESLADFLDPTDPARTIEGYPGPVRATVIAERT